MDEGSEPVAEDDRPPICPACGVTMGIVIDDLGATRHVCLECGFSDEAIGRSAHGGWPLERTDAGA